MVSTLLRTAGVAASLALGAGAQWGPVTAGTGPTPRAGQLMAYDLVGARTLLFGGNGGNEFWSFAAGAWTQLTPALLPSPRMRANLAGDPFAGTIVLYGGDGGPQFALDETWSWDGTSWQLQSPAHTPGGLARHGMAFDAARQLIVLFGGRNNSWAPNQALAATWEWNGVDWTLATPVQSPPGRVEMAMGFHPALGKVVLFGGRDGSGTALDDTWVYDGVTWTQVNATGVRPVARVGAQLVPVLGRNLAVLFGGRDPVTMAIHNDTWEHDGTSWVQVANVYGGIYPPRADFGLVHDLARNRLVAFGGAIANGALQDDTWEYGAQFQPFGMGCTGSAGVPTLAGGAPPILGTTATAVLTGLPTGSPFAFLAIGVSRTQWALGSLPMLLTAFGMPGCRTYTSADLLVPIAAVAGSATWSWNVPPLPALVGAAVHLQGVSWDPGLNAMGLATSNAATLVVGN